MEEFREEEKQQHIEIQSINSSFLRVLFGSFHERLSKEINQRKVFI